jgi:hypothetical protein
MAHLINLKKSDFLMSCYARNSFFFFSFFLPFTRPSSILSITGRDQTGYTVRGGFCMFPQSCDLRTETAGSLKCMLDVLNACTHWTSVYRLIQRTWESPAPSNSGISYKLKNPCPWRVSNPEPLTLEMDVLPLRHWLSFNLPRGVWISHTKFALYFNFKFCF